MYSFEHDKPVKLRYWPAYPQGGIVRIPDSIKGPLRDPPYSSEKPDTRLPESTKQVRYCA